MAWIATIIGAGVGLYGANQQRKAQDKQTDALMAGFNQYKPYVDDMLSGSQATLNDQLSAGYYQGQTYAGPNALQTRTADAMGAAGTNMMGSGADMMGANAGFGNNYQNLYGMSLNNASNIGNYAGNFDALVNAQGNVGSQFQNLASRAQNTDFLGNATNYASANSDPLVRATLRDDRRNLEEDVLTGIDKAASGSGNMNSSRAGVAQAIAERGYSDRYADTKASIESSLRDQSLGQQNNQFNMANSALGNMSGSIANQGNLTNSGMGAYGAANNALGMAGNFNSGISSAYDTGMNTLSAGGQFGMNAGNAIQGWDQAALNNQRSNWEGNRDYAMNTYANYNNGILGRAPNSSQNVEPNYNSPMAGAMGGAMAGYGFMQNNPNFSIDVPIKPSSWFGWP